MSARTPLRLLRVHLREITRRAVAAARVRQREIAGVLVSHGDVISLVELPNVSRRRGRFDLRRDHIKAVALAARRLGARLVGTFHSHVASEAKPGRGDLAEAQQDGSLMLIIDTIAREALLWRIRGARAYKVRHEVV